MKRIATIAVLALLALPLAALAGQGTGDFPFELDEGLVAAIQTVFGIGLLGIVQLVKNGIKKIFKDWDKWTALARHAVMYTVTGLLSAGVTYFVLTQAEMMATGRFILYGIWAWGLCNGWWKALKELVQKHK